MKSLKELKEGLVFFLVVLALVSVALLPSFPVSSQGSTYYLVCVATYRTVNVSVISYYAVPLERVTELISSNKTLVSFIHKAVEGEKNLTYLGTTTSPIVLEILKASMPQCLNNVKRTVVGVWIVKGLQQISDIKLTYESLYAVEGGKESGNFSTNSIHTWTIQATNPSSITTELIPTVTKSIATSSPTRSVSTLTTYLRSVTTAGYSAEKPVNTLVAKSLATLIGVAIASLAVLITYELIIRK